MEKTTPKKLKGTVLFTVVSVMMVLIVFLAGTLALATTASNRAHRNYQTAQAEAVARTVLDSAIKAIEEDAGAKDGLKDKIGKLKGTSNELTMNVTGTDGLSETATVRYMETRRSYSAAQQDWVDSNVYEVSTVVHHGSTGLDVTYNAYIVDDYDASSDGNSGGGGGGGGFTAYGELQGKIGTSGFISGGTVIGLDVPEIKDYAIDNSAYQMAPFYLNGNLDVKSQCTVYFNRITEGQFYAVTGNLTLSNNFDIKAPDSITWPYEAKRDAEGKPIPMKDAEGNIIKNEYGHPIYEPEMVGGKVKYQTMSYAAIPSFYVGGTLRQTASDLSFNKNFDMPLNIYCGAIESATANALSFKGDIYCFDEGKTSKLINQNPCTLLYQWAERTVSLPDGSDKTTEFGNLYSKGNVELGMKIDGNVQVEKNLTIKSPHAKAKTVVVGGTLTIESGQKLECDEIYASNIVNNGGTIACDADKIHAVSATGIPDYASIDPSALTSEISTTKVWYTDYNQTMWNQNPGGSQYGFTATKHTVGADGVDHTETISETNWWYPYDSAVYPTLADALRAKTDSKYAEVMDHTSEATALSVDSTSYDLSSVYGEPVYPQGYTKDELMDNVVKKYLTKTNLPNVPTTLDEMKATATVSETAYDLSTVGKIDNPITTSGLLTGSSQGDIYIEADSSIVVYVKDFSMSSGHNIYIKDNKTVYFFVEGYFHMYGGNIMTYDYKNILSSGGEITITQRQPNETSPYYPNVIFYGAEGSSFTTDNNSLITANFKAPKLDYKQDNGIQIGTKIKYVTIDDCNNTSVYEYNNGSSVGVIGQLICNKITTTNGFGLIYVTLNKLPGGKLPDDSDSDSDGIPDRFYNFYYNYY